MLISSVVGLGFESEDDVECRFTTALLSPQIVLLNVPKDNQEGE
jgi:hypothetical protein